MRIVTKNFVSFGLLTCLEHTVTSLFLYPMFRKCSLAICTGKKCHPNITGKDVLQKQCMPIFEFVNNNFPDEISVKF